MLLRVAEASEEDRFLKEVELKDQGGEEEEMRVKCFKSYN
jgi:hypothetical protein